MAEGQITYDHNAIDAGLSDAGSYLAKARAARGEIEQMFLSLNEIYGGQAAAALNEVQKKISVQFEDMFNKTDDTIKHATDQNIGMKALDNANASELFSIV
ncbi:hypothetical protein QSJ18_13450 [Gordonia sp. ABSL1-1]|uniref:hypothetical protein n=1 Tax=Gordonia sp. ABSL1-1 TaxID=3053923 RepID=UPI002572E540|nr:hypothetical protein [Gordonia sp. ABSL1-1]MDL9937753.1 hypothetical protein [Gordonia sp. ABSL1-1]